MSKSYCEAQPWALLNLGKGLRPSCVLWELAVEAGEFAVLPLKSPLSSVAHQRGRHCFIFSQSFPAQTPLHGVLDLRRLHMQGDGT